MDAQINRAVIVSFPKSLAARAGLRRRRARLTLLADQMGRTFSLSPDQADMLASVTAEIVELQSFDPGLLKYLHGRYRTLAARERRRLRSNKAGRQT